MNIGLVSIQIFKPLIEVFIAWKFSPVLLINVTSLAITSENSQPQI